MAFVNLGASANPDLFSTSNTSSYANTAWMPPASGLLICFVQNSKSSAPNAVNSLTGNGITWSNIASIVNSSDIMRLTLFAANASGSSNGATTADFAGVNQSGCALSFFHCDDADLSGGVVASIIQAVTNAGAASQTSGSITLSAAANSNNRPIAGFVHGAATESTPRTNWTEMDDGTYATPDRGMETQVRSDAFETTASVTWTTSSAWCGIAAEIKIAGASPVTITLDTASSLTNGRVTDVIPGVVNKLLDVALLLSNGRLTDIVPGAVSKLLDVALINANGRVITFDGLNTILLDTSLLTVNGRLITIVKGGKITPLDTSLLLSVGNALDTNPGVFNLSLDTALINSIGNDIVISVGAHSVLLDSAIVTANGRQVSVFIVSGIMLNTAIVNAVGEDIDTQPGGVIKLLDTSLLISNGQLIDIIPHVSIRLLDTANLFASGIDISVIEGAYVINLDTSILQTIGNSIIISAEHDIITIPLSSAIVNSLSYDINLGLGSVIIPLSTSAILSISPDIIISSIVAVVRAWTLSDRSTELTIEDRSVDLTIETRETTFTLSEDGR